LTLSPLLMLELADAMTATPVDVPEPLFRTLERELGADGLVELAATIAWENYRARFNHTFGAESEGYADGAACAIPARASLPGLPPGSRSA
jgi:alkylhydroperoxidase family enzyme